MSSVSTMAWAVYVREDPTLDASTPIPPAVPAFILRVMIQDNANLLTSSTRINVFMYNKQEERTTLVCTLSQKQIWVSLNACVHPEQVIFTMDVQGHLKDNHHGSMIGITVSGTYQFYQNAPVTASPGRTVNGGYKDNDKTAAWKEVASQMKALEARIHEIRTCERGTVTRQKNGIKKTTEEMIIVDILLEQMRVEKWLTDLKEDMKKLKEKVVVLARKDGVNF